MNNGHPGYGSGKVNITLVELSPGHFFFETAEGSNPAEAAPFFSHAIVDWEKANPEKWLRTSLPIVANGNTVAVHLWAD